MMCIGYWVGHIDGYWKRAEEDLHRKIDALADSKGEQA
jgi:hypothetical protein